MTKERANHRQTSLLPNDSNYAPLPLFAYIHFTFAQNISQVLLREYSDFLLEKV